MTPSKGDVAETGAAVVEFVVLGVLLMVPLVYLVLALGRVQAASFAADASAREAARAFVTAADDRASRQRAGIAVRLALRDQGFAADDATLDVDCDRSPCLSAGARVRVSVRVDVGLPGVPRALATGVTVRSTQTATVDEFRATGPPP